MCAWEEASLPLLRKASMIPCLAQAICSMAIWKREVLSSDKYTKMPYTGDSFRGKAQQKLYLLCLLLCFLLPWEVRGWWQQQHYGLFCCGLCVETQAGWPAPKGSVQGGRNPWNPSLLPALPVLQRTLGVPKAHHEQMPQSLLAVSWRTSLLKHTMRTKISLMVQKRTETAVLCDGKWSWPVHGTGLMEWNAVREVAGAGCTDWMV